MKQIIVIALLFTALASNACLNTYQFKIFPVGVVGDTIITVDFQIRRTSQVEGNSWLGLNMEKPDEWEEMWILNGYISLYDKNQKIISSIPLDKTSVYSLEKDYTYTLQGQFNLAFSIIQKEYPAIELFVPDYVSFCDFQKKCNLLEVVNDSINEDDFLVYNAQKYPIYVLKDTSYYGFDNSPYYWPTTEGLYVNSVRILKSKKITLIVAHLATGHELGMGWITNNPKEVEEAEKNEDIKILVAEYKAQFPFVDIKKSVFKEPLLHHGFGFDVFIVK